MESLTTLDSSCFVYFVPDAPAETQASSSIDDSNFTTYLAKSDGHLHRAYRSCSELRNSDLKCSEETPGTESRHSTWLLTANNATVLMFNSYRFHKHIILLFLVPTMRADHSLPKTPNLLTFSFALLTITSHTFSDKSHIRFRKLDQSTESASQIFSLHSTIFIT